MTRIIIILLCFFSTIVNAQTLRINEFMASNSSSITDKDGEYSDWIEIYNTADDSISLEGWSLTDTKLAPQQWIFPPIKLAGSSYLIVFASGKNIAVKGHELHTNFKLSGTGEYLAFIDSAGTVISEFDPFPLQQPDFSYACFDTLYKATASPTPGSPNKIFANQQLPAPQFSHKHGFYFAPFNVSLSSEIPGVKIYYTTNGSRPDTSTGTLYTAPVLISTTTIVRAVTVADSFKSGVATSTYLFLDSVINQSNTPSGYPVMWGPYFETGTGLEGGNAIGDYEMDPEINKDPQYSNLMDDALLSLPTLSIVTDIGNLFSHSTNPDSGGIYIYTGPADAGGPELGGDWERPASIEYFNSADSIDFQINCGLRIHGGHSRRPEKTPKHSFRVIFRSDYGPPKLNYPLFGKDAASSFNTLIIRTGFGNMWTHHSASERVKAQLIRDLWGKQTQLEMGHPGGHGNYVHLYINGMYWGIYNPTERIDGVFASSYLGGNKEDYDVIKDYSEIVDGNADAWNAMMTLANAGLTSNANYMRIQGKNSDGSDNPAYPAYVDVVNFIDYMLINFYGGNWDWDHHNWVAARNRVEPGKGFKFFSWDAEHILEDVNANILTENNANNPSRLFQQLRQNALFRRLFADRVQLHFFNNGVLTPAAGIHRWMSNADQIDTAIIAESARWGDYRRDVHPWRPGGPFELYTKEHWLAEQSFLLNTYFPNRSNTFITQLKSAGLFPNTAAPQFLINGKPFTQKTITAGDTLTMQSSGGATYYTLNGADPLTMAGAISPDAIQYTGKIILDESAHINARTLQNNVWSAVNAQFFDLPADVKNLKITEIHYHPLGEDSTDEKSFEFIELKNTGAFPLDVSGIQFIKGISYSFPLNTILNPGAFAVIASDAFYFNERYGFHPFGEHDGTLDNSGEHIIMGAPSGDTLVSLQYNDKAPWPLSADGGGYSLVPVDPNASGDPNDPAQWRASLQIHGSPGSDDIVTAVNNKLNDALPKVFSLSQNYPNPFNSATTIGFTIPALSPYPSPNGRGDGVRVVLKVFDLLGREVKTLVNELKDVGYYSVNFDASKLSSGVYFYRMETSSGFVQTKKLVLLK